MLKTAALLLLLSVCNAEAFEKGLASVYWENDGSEQSHRVATGSKYNPYSLTAAHRTLPFGTLVHVVNSLTKEGVYLKINDRGPCNTPKCKATRPDLKKRIIDLTPEAADRIHLAGLGPVEVWVCKTQHGIRFCT